MGAVRLRRRLRRRDHRRDLREQLPEGLPLHPRALRGDRRAGGGRRAAREARGRPAAPPRPHLRRARRARRPGRAYAAEHPLALDEAVAAIREDDVFTYIYTSGTTGPPKACMISHLNYYAMVAVVDDLRRLHGRRRLDAALPPARPQLRAAHAPLGPVRRLHDRVLPRPARGRRRAAHGRADRVPERAPGLREDPHDGAGPVRSGDRSEAAADRLGRSGRPPRERAARRARAHPGARSPRSTGSPPGSSTRRSRRASAGSCASASPAAHRSRRRWRSSSTRSTS